MISVIAIFDIGKTNKKLLLFNEAYEVVYEKSESLPETQDEDGDPCENLEGLTNWIKSSFPEIQSTKKFKIKALNFSGYGASFVHLDRSGKPVAPLYNYLKPFPASLKSKFYSTYGDENEIARATASPVLGNLNSGMQLYFLKHAKPELFNKIVVSLHLPQYLSYLFTGHYFSDITSLGCHTQLWDFERQKYHAWVLEEKLDRLLPPIAPSGSVVKSIVNGEEIMCGIGLHDSSSALIPYLKNFKEPFILLSTGTWSISLNPFNSDPLTQKELHQDCLCYLSYEGKPVKASRLLAGHEHEQIVRRLADRFNVNENYFNSVRFAGALVKTPFNNSDNQEFDNCEQAYHTLVHALVQKQVDSTSLIVNREVSRIFVDGGFSKNDVFMNILAQCFPSLPVYATSLAQATALGAALIMEQQQPGKSLYEHFPMRQYGEL